METYETWRYVLGYEKVYEVSDLGRVRRVAPGQGTKTGIVKPQLGNGGYYSMRLCHKGKCRTLRVHRMVTDAFIRFIPDGLCVNHLDGNKLNNRLSNLEITTPSGNMRHAIDVLAYKPTAQKGEQNGYAKMTDEKVLSIRAFTNYRGYATMVAHMYGISVSCADRIIKGKTWRHLL